MPETEKTLLYSLIYEAVCEIPTGNVATYGQIAKLIGLPRHARHVGFALAKLNGNSHIPWWRVINAKGEVHSKHNGELSNQIILLKSEGVGFKPNWRINLKTYQWNHSN